MIIARRTDSVVGLYAVGEDEGAAALSGVPVQTVRMKTYIAAGLLYGLAGFMLSAQTATGNPNAGTPFLMLSFATTVFLSAFLLFQIQPIIAKMILPWFGGASSVWSVCLVFFQAELLLGYLYVHLLHESLSPRRQNLVHGFLFCKSKPS